MTPSFFALLPQGRAQTLERDTLENPDAQALRNRKFPALDA
jgi:hypothetical protein